MRVCCESGCDRQATRRYLCQPHYRRRLKANDLDLPPKMPNRFIVEATQLYDDLKAIQDAKVEEFAIGYAKERRLYFSEVEPAIRLADCLKAVAHEYRQRTLAI